MKLIVTMKIIMYLQLITAPSCALAMEQALKRPRPEAPGFIKTTQRSTKKTCLIPTETALRERLHEYTYFLNHSDFLKRVAGKQLTAVQIAQEFYASNEVYLTFLKEQGWSPIALEGTALFHKNIIPLLLAEYPTEITRLALLGLYKPID